MNAMTTRPVWLDQSESDNTLACVPEWLKEFRLSSWDAFLKNGLPTRKDERWKYTDFGFLANQRYSAAKHFDVDELSDVIHQHRLQHGESILLVFVNGYFTPQLSDLAKLPEGVQVCGMNEALQKYPEQVRVNWGAAIDEKKYPFASLNTAMFVDGLYLSIPDHCELSVPVHLLSMVVGEGEWIMQPHHVIVLGKNSQMTLVEEHFSQVDQAYMMNIVTTLNVDESARLQYYKIQNEGKNAVHMANTFVTQKKKSVVSCANFSSGAAFARDDLMIKLQEAGADCHTSGFYHLRYKDQYIDNHVDIDHAAPRSNSEMLYKGIIDAKARAVFNGRLYVEKDAQKIIAYQANHNLLLSKDAEVYSKPELEIYADDVKCKHGATTGQLDEEALFYLRSRGINKEEAITMLLNGFSDEIIQRITHAGIKMRVQEIL